MKFWLHYMKARIRGLGRKYNVFPKGGHGVSTGIFKIKEIRTMYKKHQWIPYCATGHSTSFIDKKRKNRPDVYRAYRQLERTFPGIDL